MHLHVQKTVLLEGTLTVPPSKSEAVRALIFSLLATGTSHIRNLLVADDTTDAMKACLTLGARIQRDQNHLTVVSAGTPIEQNSMALFTGNSGLTTRFMLPLLGLRANSDLPIHLNCGNQMRARPITALLEALTDLGMEIEYTKSQGALPVSVRGPLLGGAITLQEPISQFLSALLIALPLAPNDSEIRVADLSSRPYVNITLAWLKRLGIKLRHDEHNNIDTFFIPGNQRYPTFDYTLPGDFSSASYFIAAGVMCGKTITLKGLDMDHEQGDKALISILQQMGADMTLHDDQIIISGGKSLTGIHIDANSFPDLVPTLAVLGTFATTPTHINNVAHARLKETDRIHSMTEGLRAMGAHIEERSDGMIIHPSSLSGASVKGYGDHRTVMALSLAGLCAEGVTIISDGESIAKTFPTFITDMNTLGAGMEMMA